MIKALGVIIAVVMGTFWSVDLASTSQPPAAGKAAVAEAVYLTAKAESNLTVSLSWTSRADAQYFVVKRGVSPDRLAPVSPPVAGTGYTDRSADPILQDYYYSVAPVVYGVEAEASPPVLLPKAKLLFNQNQKIPVLTYHEVVPEGHKIGRPGLIVTAGEFREQMLFLKNRGYTAMFLRDLYAYLADRRPLPGKAIVVTFDDGYKSFYELVYPVLKELNLKASVGVITGPMDNDNAYYYISWKQAREMAESGLVEIVSHTNTHKKLDAVPSAEAAREITVSDKTIAKYLGRETDILIYPVGGYNDGVIRSVKKEYRLGVSMRHGVNRYGTNPYIIRRCRVSHGETGEDIERHFMRYK